MGSGNIIPLLVEVLSGPLILLYPMWCTIQAIESGPATVHRSLLRYWVIFSIVTLFEAAVSPILEWLPWDLVKMVVNVILILPYFNGSAFVYDQIKARIHTIYSSVDMTYVNNRLSNLLEILSKAWKYIYDTAQWLLSKDSQPSPTPPGNDDNSGGSRSESLYVHNSYNSGVPHLRTIRPTRNSFN